MRLTFSASALALAPLPVASPAFSQQIAKSSRPRDTPEPQATPIAVTGGVMALTDYRLRRVSQSDRNPAVQGALTSALESGFYVGTFASNIAGWDIFGGVKPGFDAIPGTPRTVNVSRIDTDISRRAPAYLQRSFSKGQDGTGSIAGSTAYASLTAAF